MRAALWLAFAVAGSVAAPLMAQDDPRVAFVARLLEAEDRRVYSPELFEAALRDPDPIVRRQAVLGAGRIQDHRATSTLLELLNSPDTTLHAATMFALGLLGDTSAVARILSRLANPAPLATGATAEAASTLAKLGTPLARTAVRDLLGGQVAGITDARRGLMLPGLLVESWRFGREAPVELAVGYLTDTSESIRWKAAYLLGRTRASVGTRALLASAMDPTPWVRQYALRGLTRIAVDSAGVPRDSIYLVLVRALSDPDPGVRVNALQALASIADSARLDLAAAALRDSIPNVRLQAITTVGALGGRAGLALLAGIADTPGEPFVMRREALLGLLRADTARVAAMAAQLASSPARGERLLAIELATAARVADIAPFVPLIRDPEPEVQAAALSALGVLSVHLDVEILGVAIGLRSHPDSRLRSVGWTQFGRLASRPEYIPTLVRGLEGELALGPAGVPGPIVAALRRLHAGGGAVAEAVETHFLRTTTPPAEYLLRRAMQGWPALAARWGSVWPAETRYSPAEYQELVRRYLLNPATARPRVRIATEGGGVVELELLGDQAPLTVANFLELVDRGFFDGGEWHRVIPNFVVQDGAGGPGAGRAGAPIRDEFNPVRYEGPVLGMALSGPDTGTSQWFINLSPQPHLDGGYTVFGRVVGGAAPLSLILQGDQLISIRR
ncbi:MAG TPA: HEAT repeat domain-containing protein [Gemmatimonadales bacterium]|nr:HEAT repeat domain-containing protein [Gemmatimonadales bacterium]